MKRTREKDHKSQKSRVVFLCCIIVCVLILGVILSLVVNGHVTSSTGSAILSREEVSSLEDVSCIFVLGCLVRDDGEPGGMLEDRLEVGIALYRDGVAPKLLMSGDHGRTIRQHSDPRMPDPRMCFPVGAGHSLGSGEIILQERRQISCVIRGKAVGDHRVAQG